MSIEWPALGQTIKKKNPLEASSFAAAVKVNAAAKNEEPTSSSAQNAEQSQVPAVSWEEKKANIRAAKQAMKEEKRLRREESARKQLLAPKGYRVQLIQKAPSNSNEKSIHGNSDIFPTLDSSFPELGSRISARNKQPETIPTPVPAIDLDTSDVLAKLTPRKKKPEKNLTVSLEHLIRTRPKKVIATKKRKRKPNLALREESLSGNPLDSSQPVRHRGKVREVPKKKRHSSLKSAIYAYRKLKQLQREGFEKVNNAAVDEVTELIKEEIPFKEVIDLKSKEVNELPLKSSEISPLENPITAKDFVHSRKFREYCDNLLGKELDECVEKLLKALVNMQDRSYQKDPNKYKKRIISGLHEAKKTLVGKKAKFVVIAPDLEKCPQPGGLDEKILEIIRLARESQTPYMFALGRRKLGKILIKKVPISCAVVINSDGAEDLLEATLEELRTKREEYKSVTWQNVQKPSRASPTLQHSDNKTDVNKIVVTSLLSALEKSLQAPTVPEFLRVIDSIHAEDSD
ncbi:selenocysteine insertion sequence-binding protein 2 [Neocloeon triangulifer]|uniref:selenocysteine insertion sequence-binding protein 2 n=1 Tax=Neocloeon triangulifer TaxID=2078957 RepID=UPI00286EC4F7|nr:selenocysteine insertion sequence-binding protein 2 [Neocloeon triangulifer]